MSEEIEYEKYKKAFIDLGIDLGLKTESYKNKYNLMNGEEYKEFILKIYIQNKILIFFFFDNGKLDYLDLLDVDEEWHN